MLQPGQPASWIMELVRTTAAPPLQVGRRVAQLERALGVVQLRGRAADVGATPQEPVRLATNEALANLLVLPRWAELSPRYPGLVLELVIGSVILDLYRRDADLALRLVRLEAGGLTVRKLGIQAYAVYAWL